MARRLPSYFPQRVNMRVPAMRGVGQMVGLGTDIIAAELGAPVALNLAGILAAISSAATPTFPKTAFAATYLETNAVMGIWGRNVSVTASVATGGTSLVANIVGRDYLGQKMVEAVTVANGDGTTPVQGKKAFKYVDSIVVATSPAAAGNITVGFGNVLGLPYKFMQIVTEMKNGIVAANAGTFVAGLATGTAATAANADVRGTYLPLTVIPDGVTTFALRYVADNSNGHGNAQFGG